MAKHSRKRQRLEKATDNDPLPLGARPSLTDNASKDDEERRLESLLFGTPFVPSGKGKDTVLVVGNESDGGDEASAGGAAEFEGLLDDDLFFIDNAAPSNNDAIAEPDIVDLEASHGSVQSEDEAGEGGDADTDEDGDEDEEEDVDEDGNEETPQISAPDEHSPLESSLPKSRKAPAWTDPDDNTLEISLTSSTRLRKLRDAPSEDTLGGREYERRLRRQYEKIYPTPEWAADARKKRSKRRREGQGDSEAEEGVEELVASTRGILSSDRKEGRIEPGVLAIERLRDANQAAQAEGEIKSIQFHPSPSVSVLLAASADRRVRLFNVDGHTNPHLQTLHIPSLPVTNAQFHPSGSSVLLTGQRPFYYTYDLQSGATIRSPRGLWGTTFNASNPSAQDQSMEICAFDPTGQVLAVAGRRGYVHLVDWTSGGGQVVGSIKANASVKALWWARGPRGGARELMTLGEDAEIYVWDVGERKCVRRWKDDGGYGSRVLCGDQAGSYVSVGSKSGIVNVYSSDAVSSAEKVRPKPLKAIGNLTTSISAARFNHDSQLLAIASNVKKDQMRLIHLPSLTAFSNWPTSSTPLGHVTSVDFSVGSEYIAVGNTRGRVLLYHLRDFGAR